MSDYAQRFADICMDERKLLNIFDSNDAPFRIARECCVVPQNQPGVTKVAEQLASYNELLYLQDDAEGYKGSYFFFDDYLAIVRLPSEYEKKMHNLKDQEVILVPYYNIDALSIEEKVEEHEKGNAHTLYVIIECTKDIRAKLPAINFVKNNKSSIKHLLMPLNIAPYINSRLTNGRFAIKTGLIANMAEQAVIDETINCLKDIVDVINDNIAAQKKRMSATIRLFGITPAACSINNYIENEKMFIEKLVGSLEECILEEDRNTISNNYDQLLAESEQRALTIKEKIEDVKVAIQEQRNAVSQAGFFKRKEETAKLLLLEESEKKLAEELGKTGDARSLNKAFLSFIEEYYGNEYIVLDEKKLKQILNECERRGVSKVSDNQSQLLFDVICKKYNIPKEFRTDQLLETARHINTSEEQLMVKMREKDEREEKLKLRQETEELLKLVGVQKYLYAINNRRNIIKQEIKSIENRQLMKEYIRLNPKEGKKQSWGVAGGVASAIAGPGVGAVAALNTIEKNKAIDKFEQDMAERNQSVRTETADMKSPLERQLSILDKKEENINKKLCDTDNTDLYFGYYSFSVEQETIQKDGTLQVEISAQRAMPFKLGSMEIDVDGALVIRVLRDNNEIGTGYLLGDGFRDEDPVRGFSSSKKYVVDIIPENESYRFMPNEPYRYSIEPVHMWMIEK